jgi:hypothetical protein
MDDLQMKRFEMFAARKTAEARSATLRAFVTEFDRAATDLEPIGNDWSRATSCRRGRAASRERRCIRGRWKPAPSCANTGRRTSQPSCSST